MKIASPKLTKSQPPLFENKILTMEARMNTITELKSWKPNCLGNDFYFTFLIILSIFGSIFIHVGNEKDEA